MLRFLSIGPAMLALAAILALVPCSAEAQIPESLAGDGHPVALVQFAPNGSALVAIDNHGQALVWDLPGLTRRAAFRLELPIAHALAVTNDARQIVVAGPDRRLYLLSAADGKEAARSEPQTGTIHCLAISPDGATVAAGSGAFASRGTVTLNAAADLARQHVVDDFQWPSYALAWSPDGAHLVSGGGRVLQPAEAWLLNGRTGEPTAALGGGHDLFRVAAFAPNNAAVALAGREGAIRLYEVPSGKPLRTIAPVLGEIVALSYTDDGRKIAAVIGDGLIRIWDAATGAPVTTLCAPRTHHGQAAFSRDGKLLALGTPKGTVQLYDLAALENWRALGAGHRGPCDRLACDAPNVLLIVADGLGYGDLGCYGQSKIQTPHLDRLAAEGMRLTDYYAGGATNAPAQCTLLTGRSAGHARIRGADQPVPLEPGDITVAEMLRASNYATGLFGRWHGGDKDSTGAPFRQGFDAFLGFYTAAEMADSYPDAIWNKDVSTPIADNAGGATRRDSAGILARAAAQFLSDHRNGPFFVMVNFPQSLAAADRVDVAPYAGEPWPEPAQRYAATVTRFDAAVGALLQRLDDLNLRTNTLVIVTGDGGPARDEQHDAAFFLSTGGLRGERGSLYEGGLRVPMIVRWPRRIRAGSSSSQPAAHYDLLPTLAELAGARCLPRVVDGVSLAPLFSGGQLVEADAYRPIYAEKHEGGFQQAVRFGQWKAVRNALQGPLELFDLVEDPEETTNLAGDSPELVAEAEQLLRDARSPSAAWPAAGE